MTARTVTMSRTGDGVAVSIRQGGITRSATAHKDGGVFYSEVQHDAGSAWGGHFPAAAAALFKTVGSEFAEAAGVAESLASTPGRPGRSDR